eukprot:CAMPEP_0168537258 /NCGR_PEP_ID=MMETSP0405-20121227/20191_1 /TAXON_ID=498012 /ORGANISM="Trichosphaerium sp, Strain Am-I-7 wt" /LENGTH=347 /DNA_ID=CAMNT_0008565727 /DNA_START=300 /DNA_END=1343 /DNA_ORIENTATION=-
MPTNNAGPEKTCALIAADLERNCIIGFFQIGKIWSSDVLQKFVASLCEKPYVQGQPSHTILDPFRPQKILFSQSNIQAEVNEFLSSLNITTGASQRPQIVQVMVSQLKQTAEQGLPNLAAAGLTSIEGVDHKFVHALWDSAAFFYTKKPWTNVDNLQFFGVQVESLPMKYCVLMGLGAHQYGLSVSNTKEALNLYFQTEEQIWNDMDTLIHSVQYGSIRELPYQDIKDFTKNTYPVVGFGQTDPSELRTFPLFSVFSKKEGLLRPSKEMLEFYEIALRALPNFVDKMKPAPDYHKYFPSTFMPLTDTWQVKSGISGTMKTIKVVYPCFTPPESFMKNRPPPGTPLPQ